MKNTICKKTNFLFIAVIGISLLFSTPVVLAADDPSIKGDLRQSIMDSMKTFIDNRIVNDRFYIYDASQGKLLKLKFDKLHEGIVKKGDFYVSCADFFDSSGKKIDLDFLVVKDGSQLKTIQAVVHSVDGKKRKYHLESYGSYESVQSSGGMILTVLNPDAEHSRHLLVAIYNRNLGKKEKV